MDSNIQEDSLNKTSEQSTEPNTSIPLSTNIPPIRILYNTPPSTIQLIHGEETEENNVNFNSDSSNSSLGSSTASTTIHIISNENANTNKANSNFSPLSNVKFNNSAEDLNEDSIPVIITEANAQVNISNIIINNRNNNSPLKSTEANGANSHKVLDYNSEEISSSSSASSPNNLGGHQKKTKVIKKKRLDKNFRNKQYVYDDNDDDDDEADENEEEFRNRAKERNVASRLDFRRDEFEDEDNNKQFEENEDSYENDKTLLSNQMNKQVKLEKTVNAKLVFLGCN